MTDNGGNDRRRDIEGRINTLGAGSNGVSDSERRRSGEASADDTDDGVDSGLGDDGPDTAASTETDGDADSDSIAVGDGDADDGSDIDGENDADESETEGGEEADDDAPFERREEDVDERNALEIELDQFVRAFAARRADEIGEESLDEYIVGSVKGYLAGLLGGDVESPGTLQRDLDVEADEILGGLLDAVAEDDQDREDVVLAAVAEAYGVPEDDEIVVAGLRDHEALLNGVVANSSNSLGDVSEVVQAAVETRLLEEPAD